MSGGSYDYVYSKVGEFTVAMRRKHHNSPWHQAFAVHLDKVEAAMKAVEWADSGDTDDEDALAAIRRVIAPEAAISQARAQAEEAVARLQGILAEETAGKPACGGKSGRGPIARTGNQPGGTVLGGESPANRDEAAGGDPCHDFLAARKRAGGKTSAYFASGERGPARDAFESALRSIAGVKDIAETGPGWIRFRATRAGYRAVMRAAGDAIVTWPDPCGGPPR